MSAEIYNPNTYVESLRLDERSRTEGGENRSWLVELAEILGKMADRLGKQMIDKAREIDGILEADPDAQVAELNAELQAMTQTLNMLMQAINTIIKSIGEGARDMARKQ